MKALETWMLGYLLNSLWQIPLIFFAGWIAAKLAQKTGPAMEHRIWVAALILETTLPACQLQPGDLWRAAWALLLPHSSVTEDVHIFFGPVTANGTNMFHLPGYFLSLFLIAYVGSLFYFAGRLAWGLSKTRSLLQDAAPVILDRDQAVSWSRLRRQLKDRRVEIAMSRGTTGPITVGVWRPVLLVPPSFLEQISREDMDAILAHEFAHVLRRDFAKNLLYGFLSLPVAYHPLLWLTRSKIAGSRELICDAVAATALGGRDRYARSLLRLAMIMSTPQPKAISHAIGIFDANNFERRIMNLTKKQIEVPRAVRVALVAVCGVIAIAACTSALALRMDVNAPAPQNTHQRPIKVKSDLMAGMLVYHEMPKYPPEAKANNNQIDGEVVLAVTIGKDGAPEGIHVKKSLRRDYDLSALNAVKAWRWKPYLLNGEPVEVDTEVSVVFSSKH